VLRLIAFSTLDRSSTAFQFAKAFEGDRDVERIIRAAVNPADTTSGLLGYAQVLLKALAPISASAALVDHVGALSWPAGVGNLLVPAINMTGLAQFVGEGAPIPVPQGLSSKVTLSPYKLALITALSGELFRYTASEQLIERALTESIGYSLDGLMLSTNAAVTGVSPPGLLHNVTPLPPAPLGGNSDFVQAMYEDLAQLAGAVSVVSGNDEQGVCLIGAAKQAAFMRLRLADVDYPIFASAALSPGTVIAVASRALAFVSKDPRFETTKQSVVHMETDPLPIGSPGSPPVVAAPTTSLFQTDSIGIRVIWPLNFTMRDARGIAFIQNTAW
jgi:hypothetical protein